MQLAQGHGDTGREARGFRSEHRVPMGGGTMENTQRIQRAALSRKRFVIASYPGHK